MSKQQVTELLNQAILGNVHVLNDVYEILYDDIKAVAGFQLRQIHTGQTITPTVLAHECYLKLYQSEHIPIENRRHFLNCLARSMRMYLIDVLRAKNSQKRQAQQVANQLVEYVGSEDVSFKLMEIDMALNQIEKIDQQLAEILQQQGNYAAGIDLILTIINADSWDDENNERAISAYNTLADMYLGNDDVLSATAYKEKSLAMAVKLLTEDSPRTWVQMLKSLEFYITVKDAEKVEAFKKKLSVIFDNNENVSDRILTRFEQMKADAQAIN